MSNLLEYGAITGGSWQCCTCQLAQPLSSWFTYLQTLLKWTCMLLLKLIFYQDLYPSNPILHFTYDNVLLSKTYIWKENRRKIFQGEVVSVIWRLFMDKIRCRPFGTHAEVNPTCEFFGNRDFAIEFLCNRVFAIECSQSSFCNRVFAIEFLRFCFFIECLR